MQEKIDEYEKQMLIAKETVKEQENDKFETIKKITEALPTTPGGLGLGLGVWFGLALGLVLPWSTAISPYCIQRRPTKRQERHDLTEEIPARVHVKVRRLN
jgi:hypothetical protein